MKILVIDDDADVRDVMERLLRKAGHEVCLAASGSKGLAMIRDEQPGLVFLDMMLGADFNGWEVAEAKKRDPAIASIPTVILTGMLPQEVHTRSVPHESMISEILLIVQKPPQPGAILKIVDLVGGLKQLCA